jgi:molecular chaperone HscB
MQIDKNYFELFSIPKSFEVDKALLSQQFRMLQKQLHPDNYANNSAAEQRISVQYASYVNTAYQTLKSPLLLAEYLLELEGHPVNSQTLTLNDPEFLLNQMEWRESLGEISEELANNESVLSISEKLDALNSEIKELHQGYLTSLNHCFENKTFDEAKTLVAKLHFVEKILADIDLLEEKIIA